MPYAANPFDGVVIYYEVAGSGPPLVLLNHGSSAMQRPRDGGYDNGPPDYFQADRFRTTQWSGFQRS
jgi:hypothetical protein